MHHLIGHGRSLMILLLVACLFRVGRAMTLEKRNNDYNDYDVQAAAASHGGDGPALLDGARDTFKWLARDTVDTSHRVMWGVGRLLLSTGESVNFVWDMALNSLVNLLKTGGEVYGTIADRVADVPIIGYGAGGIGEAIKTSLRAMESSARHDTETRKRAFAELNAKLNDSGSRLSAGRTPDTVVFPSN